MTIPHSDSSPERHPTDRDMINAIFRLLGSLSARLTGERPIVPIPHGIGNDVNDIRISPAMNEVEWTTSPTVAMPAEQEFVVQPGPAGILKTVADAIRNVTAAVYAGKNVEITTSIGTIDGPLIDGCDNPIHDGSYEIHISIPKDRS